MTLVAGLSVGGQPAFVGDLLVSWRLAEKVDIPTQSTAAVFPGLDGDHAMSLQQKLVIVRPYLMIAWAGSLSEALRAIHALDHILPSNVDDLFNLECLFSVLEDAGSDIEMLAIVCWPDRVEPYCIRTRGFEIDGKRVYVLGSGGHEFFNYIASHPDIDHVTDSNSGLIARSIAIRFAAHSFTQQMTTGKGLPLSWGGGFEVAYPEPDGFRKVDNLLVRAWVVHSDDSYDALCSFFFVKYYGPHLYINWLGSKEKTYVITSPIGVTVTPPAQERVAPI